MADNKEPAEGGLGSSAFVGILACLAAGAYFAYQQDDYVAVGAAAVVAAGVALGFWKGGVGFLALAAGAAGGYYFATTVDGVIGPWLGSAGVSSPAVRVGLCGVISAAVIQVFTLVMGKRFLRANPSLKSLNGLIGMGLGGAQSAGAVVLFLCGILAIAPQRSSVIPGLLEPATTNRVETLAFHTRKSVIFPYLQQYDPFQRFPELRQALENARQPQPPAFNAAQVPGLLGREPFRGW